MITCRRDKVGRKTLIESDVREDRDEQDQKFRNHGAERADYQRHDRKQENAPVAGEIGQPIFDPLRSFRHSSSLKNEISLQRYPGIRWSFSFSQIRARNSGNAFGPTS